MANQDKVRWTKLVADFESCDLSQREFANERGVPVSNLRCQSPSSPSHRDRPSS